MKDHWTKGGGKEVQAVEQRSSTAGEKGDLQEEVEKEDKKEADEEEEKKEDGEEKEKEEKKRSRVMDQKAKEKKRQKMINLPKEVLSSRASSTPLWEFPGSSSLYAAF